MQKLQDKDKGQYNEGSPGKNQVQEMQQQGIKAHQKEIKWIFRLFVLLYL